MYAVIRVAYASKCDGPHSLDRVWSTNSTDDQSVLREENRVLLEQLGDRRIRLTDDQRRRLAVAGKAVSRKALLDLAGLVTPDTILAWHRKLVAAKWDQREKRRGPGRPGVMKEIERLVVRFAGSKVPSPISAITSPGPRSPTS